MTSNKYTDLRTYEVTLEEECAIGYSVRCHGYRPHVFKSLLYYMVAALTGGTLFLVCHWYPAWKLRMTCVKSPLGICQFVMIDDTLGRSYIIPMNRYSTDINVFESNLINIRLLSQSHMDSMTSSATPSTNLLVENSEFSLPYFVWLHRKYFWNAETNSFVKLHGLDFNADCSWLHEQTAGLFPHQRLDLLSLYGNNVINVDVKSYPQLLFEEVLNPFYIFQICSVILWFFNVYYYYATCIIIISVISLSIAIYETHRQAQTLSDMVSHTSHVTIMTPSGEMSIDSSQLVPGDVICIPKHGCVMSVDAALLSGTCIVNEAMLTGESTPVTKAPVPHHVGEVFTVESHRRHVILCGTNILQTRYYGGQSVLAIVLRTGFLTAKGDLVKSILFPRPRGFQFYKDSMKFVGLLSILGVFGFAFTVYINVLNQIDVKHTILRAFDIITVIVPPALPAAMTVGMVYAQNRLKLTGVFCISPSAINVCGRVTVSCFDKTGTLTEEGLDLKCVLPVSEDNCGFLSSTDTPSELGTTQMTIAMATCHSLTYLDGELTGDPLDLKVFESTEWILEEPGQDCPQYGSLAPTVARPRHRYSNAIIQDSAVFEVGIIKQFSFSSGLQRMSVITRAIGMPHMMVYCKGAPEIIETLCDSRSIPANFHSKLALYTRQGYRVIAIANSELDPQVHWHQVQKMKRADVERQLKFLGLIVLENRLKVETTPVICQLRSANIRVVMITGDNILTAISVARKCHIIESTDRVILVETSASPEGKYDIHYSDSGSCVEDESETDSKGDGCAVKMGGSQLHLAVTGKSFAIIRQHFPALIPQLAFRGTVFARMSPDQKTELVEDLQSLGYSVSMCGDGANDCGALKAADAGVSLSEAEASVASPFTSAKDNIQCVPLVIREGRASLTTSFSVFRYMALYSFIEFVTVLILDYFGSNLGDWQYLYIDLIITTTIALFMGRTAASDVLVAVQPPGSLLELPILFSLCLQILAQALMQAASLYIIMTQPWFKPLQPISNSENIVCYENTVLFCVSSFMYVTVAFCFSKGAPFRKPMFTNFPYMVTLISISVANITLLFYYVPWLSNTVLQLEHLPSSSFQLTLFGIVCSHFFLAIFVEQLSEFVSRWSLSCGSSDSKLPYKLMEKKLLCNNSWPPADCISL